MVRESLSESFGSDVSREFTDQLRAGKIICVDLETGYDGIFFWHEGIKVIAYKNEIVKLSPLEILALEAE